MKTTTIPNGGDPKRRPTDSSVTEGETAGQSGRGDDPIPELVQACGATSPRVIGRCGRDAGHDGDHRSTGETFTAGFARRGLDDPIPELVQALGGAVIDAGHRIVTDAELRAGNPGLTGQAPRCGCGAMTLATTASDRHDRGLHGPFQCIGARQSDFRLREPETVAEALEDVHRRYCSAADPDPDDTRYHDPVCRILAQHVGNLEAALEAGQKREPVAPAGTTDGDRDGVTFTPEFDRDRLNRQAGDVYDTLAGEGRPTWDGLTRWWTLRELADATGHPEASVSARIRDLRKPRFGGLTIERRRRGEGRGTWEYRLELPCPRDHAGPCFPDPRLCAKILTDARAGGASLPETEGARE